MVTGSHVEPRALDPHRLEPIVGAARVDALMQTATLLRTLLDGRRIININSTANGGGVAEMLTTLVGYIRGAGLEAEWLVVSGDPDFFAVTKRLHNGLYGSSGDGGRLGRRERAVYERTTATNLDLIRREVRAGDIVIVHDPQPAGLIAQLVEHGAHVVWRCHVGNDAENEWTDRAWAFLRPYIDEAHAYVFSRESFAPAWIDRTWLRIIAPSIDPFTPKNTELAQTEVLELLGTAGFVAANGLRTDPRVREPAEIVREGSAPDPSLPLIVQVSRWDRMKDMIGVLEGFLSHVPRSDAHLVLAGPAVNGVSDDPEGEEVWQEIQAAWHNNSIVDRSRVHLAAIPMDDPVSNAYVINALQRHAAVVVQKSLAEGFGLTVAEAMWKTRPVVASAVGGIIDQIEDGETGVLIRDPHDLQSFGSAVDRLLNNREESQRLASNAHNHIVQHFLGDRHLIQYAELLTQLLCAQ